MYNGLIYKCLCKVTSKVYIGQTVQSFERRKYDHIKESFNENLPGYNFHFHRAIRKYGTDNFIWEIILKIEEESLEALQKTLDDKETYYIEKYNSYYNGYNSTKGGQGYFKEKYKIKLFEEDGKLLGIYSQEEIKKLLNITDSSYISALCTNKTKFIYRDKIRYVLRYEFDDYTEEEISEIKQIHYSQIVKMYNIDGELIETFESPKDVENKTGISARSVSGSCLHQRAYTFFKGNKYIFRYGNDVCSESDLEKAKSINDGCKKCVIAIDSKTNEIIGAYQSFSEGGRALGTKGNKICEVCSGKRKSSGKYNGNPIYWKEISYEYYENFINQSIR